MVTVDWPTKTINVPKADTTLISLGPPEIRELNVSDFRLILKGLEVTEQGIVHPRTHDHNTVVVLGGVPYARIVEIVNGYTVTFEAGAYVVRFVDANNNVQDVTNYNSTQTASANAAGLIVAETGVSGLTPAESAALLNIDTNVAQNTLDLAAMLTAITGIENATELMAAIDTGRLELDSVDSRWVIYKVGGPPWVRVGDLGYTFGSAGHELFRFACFDKDGNPSVDNIFDRVPV